MNERVSSARVGPAGRTARAVRLLVNPMAAGTRGAASFTLSFDSVSDLLTTKPIKN